MLPYNLISIRGQGNPSARQVWVCLQGFPLHDSERLSPGPATLSALAQPSALGSPAALLPWSPPGSLLSSGALHVPASLPSTDPGTAPLPSEASATHTGQSSSTFLLLSCSFFSPHVCIQTLCYSIDLLRCPQPSECQPSETGGCAFKSLLPGCLEQNMCSVNIYGLNGYISVSPDCKSWHIVYPRVRKIRRKLKLVKKYMRNNL